MLDAAMRQLQGPLEAEEAHKQIDAGASMKHRTATHASQVQRCRVLIVGLTELGQF
jgi:hypothetical protein